MIKSITPGWSAFVAGDNLFDDSVATTKAFKTVSYGEPRLVWAGLSFSG